MLIPMECERCRNTSWVCEDHPQRPRDGPRACGCGAAGMPCPRCAPDDGWDKPPDVSRVFRLVLQVRDKKVQ